MRDCAEGPEFQIPGKRDCAEGLEFETHALSDYIGAAVRLRYNKRTA